MTLCLELAPASLQQRLVKTGGRLIEHARYYWLMLAVATGYQGADDTNVPVVLKAAFDK